jgi:hypothetical protein
MSLFVVDTDHLRAAQPAVRFTFVNVQEKL